MKKIFFFLILISFCNLLSAQTIPSYVPTSDLLAWYPFSGNTVDSSGHGYDGLDSGALLTVDRFGNANSAYWFDGISSTISTLLLPPAGDGARTITCWFKYDTIVNTCGDLGMVIAGYGASNRGCYQVAKNFSLEINWTSYPVTADVDGVCVATLVSNVTDSLTNSWHFFAAVYDTSFGYDYDSVKIYLDGAFKATRTVKYSSPTSVNTDTLSRFQIGAGHYDCRRFFKGKIDDVGVWSRALTSCELLGLYLAGTNPITANPVNDTESAGVTARFSITDPWGGGTYQWQENRGSGFVNLTNIAPYSGVNTKDLVIYPTASTMNHYQYRCIRNAGNCLDTSGSAYLFVSQSGITPISRQLRLNIFPNPTKNKLNVESDVTINKIEMMDIVGQKLLVTQPLSNKATIDLSSFANGIYFIKINDLYIQKLAKQ